jgi:hypothetical protein
MVALLKQKAKVGVATKPRRTFEVSDVFKRLKQPDGSFKNAPSVQNLIDESKEQRYIKKIVKPKLLEKFDEEMKKS